MPRRSSSHLRLAVLAGAALSAAAPAAAEVTHDYEVIPALALPDNGCGAGWTDVTIPVADSFTVGDVDVGVWIAHPNRAELRVQLVAPDGTTVPLITNEGAGANLNVRFDEAAAAYPDAVDQPAPGTYYASRWQPYGNLGNLRLAAAAGSWHLQVCDSAAGNTGTIERAALFFRTGLVVAALGWSPTAVCPGYPTPVDFMVVNATAQATAFDLAYTGPGEVTGPPRTRLLAPATQMLVEAATWSPASAAPLVPESLTLTASGGGESSAEAAALAVKLFASYRDAADSPAGRQTRDPALVFVAGRLYKIGGYDGVARAYVDVYDPGSDSWTTGADLPAARYALACAAVGLKIYCSGGYDTAVRADQYVYDTAADSWATAAALPGARYYHAAVALGGKVYVLGGSAGTSPFLATVAAYDPASDTWDTTLPSMSVARRYPAAGAAGGRLVVAGGQSATGVQANVTESLAPGDSAWTVGAPHPLGGWVRAASGVVRDRYLVLAGGYPGDATASPYAFAYDATADHWEQLPSLTHSIYGAGGASDGADLWVVGGRVYENSAFSYSRHAFALLGCTTSGAGAACDDGLGCTTGDVFDATGRCAGATGCDDGLPCTWDGCYESGAQCYAIVTDGCVIGGACVATGAVEPSWPCWACQPDVATGYYSQVPAGAACDDGLFCTVGETCNAGGSCGGGSARDCSDGLACTADACDEANDRCTHQVTAGCLIAAACVPAGTRDPADQCKACQPAQSTTAYTLLPAGTACDDGLYCTVGETCDAGGACGGGGARDCSDGLACTDDGCNEALGRCESSLAAGHCLIGGACRADGELDPQNSCASCQAGAATDAWSLLPAATPCGAAACAAGVQTPAPVCDGAGACVAATPVSCGAFQCADAQSCATSCATDAGCAAGYHCGSGDCVADLPPGAACSRAAECLSGACVDGVCCDAACDGTCVACNLAGHEGTCTPVPAGADPRGECGAGGCDGTGACASGSDGGAAGDGGAPTDGGAAGDGGATADGGHPGSDGAASGDAGQGVASGGGCGCRTARPAPGGLGLLLLALLAVVRRRGGAT